MSERPGSLLRHVRYFWPVLKNTATPKQFLRGKKGDFLSAGSFHLISELKFVSRSVNSLILPGCITWPLLAAAGEAKLAGTPSIDYVGSGRSRPSVVQRVGHGCWSCTMDALLVPKFTPGEVKTATSSRG